MNTTTIIVSAVTAFVIAFTGSMITVLVAGKPSIWQVLVGLGVGLAVAAKDTRSLLKLPPVQNGNSDSTPPLSGVLKIVILLFLLSLFSMTAKAQTPSPTQLPGLPEISIDTNGLSFTNVSLQLSSGYEYQGNVGGASAGYVAGQYDVWSLKNFDVGLGGSIVLANTQDALNKADFDVAIIKNLDNFQIALQLIPIGRKFTDAPGYYFGGGFDINYNLTRGLGILGSKSGFTYVTAGIRLEKNITTIKDSSFERGARVGLGYAF